VIVATSTLELGIDVGDLDRVIQIDSPATVSSFLQRMGRTGRRPGSLGIAFS
jgi:ATP-dependent Lhr-like helicase